MICQGCYKKSAKPFCPVCRKLLFDGRNIPKELTFKSLTASDNGMSAFSGFMDHMSIPGMQLIFSLQLNKDELQLTPENGQYILKPIPINGHLEAVEELPENEHLTMQIARQVFKIKTAENAIIYFMDGQPAYITRRFDVLADGSKISQEDFSQILNKTSQLDGAHFKYGSSYHEMGQAIRAFVSASSVNLEHFFGQILFNYLISNGDAHLKNFSLIRAANGEYFLSPAYDLLCTRLHTPMESGIALDLFEGDRDFPYYKVFGRYGTPEFLELAQRFGIIEKRALRIIHEFTSKTDQINQMVEASLLSHQSKQKYMAFVKEKTSAFK